MVRLSWLVTCFLLRLAACAETSDPGEMDLSQGIMLLQHSVESRASIALAPAVHSTRREEVPTQAIQGSCLTTDVQALLSGWEEEGQQLAWGLGLPAIALLLLSTTVLLLGHRLVTPVAILASGFAAFYLLFELLKSTTTSCSLPVYASVVAGLVAAGLACCFLELAIIIPGALLGAVLAYQVQTLLMSVSPNIRASPFIQNFYWIIALVAALVFAWIAHKLREDIFILVTSVLGGFGVTISVRGLLLEYAHVSMTDLATFIVMVVVIALGMVYQHKSYKRD